MFDMGALKAAGEEMSGAVATLNRIEVLLAKLVAVQMLQRLYELDKVDEDDYYFSVERKWLLDQLGRTVFMKEPSDGDV